MEKGSNRMIEDNIEIKPLTAEQVAALDTYGESLKETSAERAARKEREDRHWNKQWALDKSVEWCKHINELVASPNNDVQGVIMTSSDVHTIADGFYSWLYKDNKS